MQNDNYNRGGYIAFLFSMVFSLLFFIYVIVIHPGVNLKEIPEPAAAEAPTQASAEAAPADPDISKIDKPWVENKDMVAHGAHVFSQNCAICHGPKGMGDGPAGLNLNPRPRNFVEGKWKKGGTSEGIFGVLQNGLPGSSMASFKHLPVKDRWALVQFIRSITHNKTKDDPAKLEAFAKTAD